MLFKQHLRISAVLAALIFTVALSCTDEVPVDNDDSKSVLTSEVVSTEQAFCPADSVLMPDAQQDYSRSSCRDLADAIEEGTARARMNDMQNCCECRLCPAGYTLEERPKLQCRDHLNALAAAQPGQCPSLGYDAVRLCCDLEEVDPIETCKGLPEAQGCEGEKCDTKNTAEECCLFDDCTPKFPIRESMSISGNGIDTCGELASIMSDYFTPGDYGCRYFQAKFSDVCEGNTVLWNGTTVMKLADMWCGPGVDNCPEDPNKIDPGECGCGVPDADRDRDGTFDCKDECPDDATKTTSGECGCGVAEGTCSNESEYCEEKELDTTNEEYANQFCSLCKDLSWVPSARGLLTIDSTGLTCYGLQLEMSDPTNASKPGSQTCHALQDKYRETCCNLDCTPKPLEDDWKPVQPPFSQGDAPVCNLCKNDQYPQKPNTVTAILGMDGNPRCRDLYWMGLTGNITDQMCNPLRWYMQEPCGCEPPETTSNEPVCDICPDGLYPLRPTTYPRDLDFPDQPSCEDLYWMGRTGEIPSSRCQQLQNDLKDPCGCLPAQ